MLIVLLMERRTYYSLFSQFARMIIINGEDECTLEKATDGSTIIQKTAEKD